MAMIKMCTDIPQSKILAKFLPLESADMYYYSVNGHSEWYKTPNILESIDDLDENSIPCWSLAALLDVLPDKVTIDGHRWSLSLRKKGISYLGYMTYDGQLHISVESDNLVDSCVNMIIKLKEQDLI